MRISSLATLVLLLAGCASAAPPPLEPPAPAQGLQNRSFVTDRRSYGPGDLITVRVEENTVARDRSRSQESSARDLNAGGGGILLPRELTNGVNTSMGRSRSDVSESSRNASFLAEVSVIIVGQTEAGLLWVEGQRVVEFDGEKKTLQVKGLVRPSDVSVHGWMFSSRLANAEIRYVEKGKILRSGWLGRALTWVWPW